MNKELLLEKYIKVAVRKALKEQEEQQQPQPKQQRKRNGSRHKNRRPAMIALI